jgi:hypothetical protein
MYAIIIDERNTGKRMNRNMKKGTEIIEYQE